MKTAKDDYVVGTRESRLALIQTDTAVDLLKSRFPELRLAVHPIKTHGDRVLDRPLAALGRQGVFVKELEEALLRGEVDFVVHSLKDLPTQMTPGLVLAAVVGRADPRDALICPKWDSLSALPPGAVIATSSRRRAAQLSAQRQDLRFVDVRGNIPTRLHKLEEGLCDAMVLAAAGLLRLELSSSIKQFFPVDMVVPAPGQGVLALQCRAEEESILQILSSVNDEHVLQQVTAERAFLNEIGGGCSVPVGAVALLESAEEGARTPGRQLKLIACIASLDGKTIMRRTASGAAGDAERLGRELARDMMKEGGADIMSDLLDSAPVAVPPP